MARNPNPVRPLSKHAKAYEKAIRAAYVDPLFARLRGRLLLAADANASWYALNAFLDDVGGMTFSGVPVDVVSAQIRAMEQYHRQRIISTFRSALAVDIRPLLVSGPIADFVRGKVTENVDLIKTIPPRMHAGLKKRLEGLLVDQPFDQQLVTKALRDEYQSTGYNLRRLCRDQTSKSIGQLTEIRQRQIGIQQYEWITSQDERVRPTHVANSGRVFAWDSPPPETGHPGEDIQCRCVAVAVVSRAQRDALKDNVGPSSVVDPSQGRRPFPFPVPPRPAPPPPAPTPPAPPTPPPVPPTPPPPRSYAEANRYLRGRDEERWHQATWNDADPEFLRILGETPPLDGLIRSRAEKAYYSRTKHKIKMDFSAKRDNAYHRGTWRHEFGHFIDNVLGTVDDKTRWGTRGWSMATSHYREAYWRAVAKDVRRFEKHLGATVNASRANVAKWDAAAARLRELTPSKRAVEIHKLAAKVGLDEGDVRAWLTKEGPFGHPGSFQLTDSSRDAVVWRFLKAWEQRDVQGFLDLHLMRGNASSYVFGSAREVRAWASHNTGFAQKFSDHMDAMTRGRTHNGFKHWGNTYDGPRGDDSRLHEIFANVIANWNAGPMGRAALERFSPSVYGLVRKHVAALPSRARKYRKIRKDKDGITIDGPTDNP